MSKLSPCSEEKVRHFIVQSLDPITTLLLKEMADVLLPYMTVMINASVSE